MTDNDQPLRDQLTAMAMRQIKDRAATDRLNKAAPELLAALKLAAQWLHDNQEGDEPLRTVCAAIAKAEGKPDER
jgi:hypothetical protein